VPRFGEKAQEIVSQALSHAGSSALELEQLLDGALEPLFLRQAALLRQQVASSLGPAGMQADALERAEERFLAEARSLVRPGSGWHLEPERRLLRMGAERGLGRLAALSEERARAARHQQLTVEVIGKLQEQMEQLQQKVQGLRGGSSPWVLSTSYRVPKTPLQLAARYEQGRANVELSLTPDKNPSESEASFVDGIGPANLGVSFNLGI